MAKVNSAWLANLRYVEENGADFFATGGSQALVGLDLNYLPGKGVNLSGTNQSLQQGYQTAKHIFEHVKPGTIKFVLIDLSPILFPPSEESSEFDALNTQKTSAEDVDLNCERAKETFRKIFSKKQLRVLELGNFTTEENFKENLQILQDYANLCSANDARPVFVIFPIDRTFKKIHNSNILTRFRQAVNEFAENHQVFLIDILKAKLSEDCFYGKSHLSSIGAATTTALLSARLCSAEIFSVKQICDMSADWFNVFSKNASNDYKDLIHYIFCKTAVDDFNRLSKIFPQDECKNLMVSVFSEMTYDHLAKLSDMLTTDDYNDLAARIFEISAEKIRHKSKIKVGFFFENPSKWCGDELYNLFARDERFEPTVFYFPKDDSLTRLEFTISLERFKSHGINVFEVPKSNFDLPQQDVLIQMSPYDSVPQSFRIINLKLTTLLSYIAYSYSVSYRPVFLNRLFSRVLWKRFFSSTIEEAIYKEACVNGAPRGFYSGYPRMDIFFDKNADFKFDWKMVRPDAKKIIWAPHHTVGEKGGATFAWNHEFMYEFAKAHPEISWVVKPHPFLLSRAVSKKVFPSAAACKDYFKKWDELPNAQVYMGAYYQAIFATSDGMIHDSGSFVAEYQYVDKPMIYLRFRMGGFSELGQKILDASYCVDGRDFDAIAAMMQRVFIEGNDYKAAERRAIFDKYLNYPKANGMLASKFIYKSITDELKEV